MPALLPRNPSAICPGALSAVSCSLVRNGGVVTRRIALLLLAAAPLLAQKADPHGWRSLRWGMSEFEVEKAVPKLAVRLPDSDWWWSVPKGGYTPFQMGATTLVGARFWVTLVFAGAPGFGTLNSVWLGHSNPKNWYLVYTDLRTALVSKHGQPTNEKKHEKDGNRFYECTWLFPTTTVKLVGYQKNVGPRLVSKFVQIKYIERKEDGPNR